MHALLGASGPLGTIVHRSRRAAAWAAVCMSQQHQQQHHPRHVVLAPPPACQAQGQQGEPHCSSAQVESQQQPASSQAAKHHSNGNGHAHHSNGSNGNGAASSREVFSGSTAAQLSSWLGRHGVDTSGYGTGLAKTVQDLLEEQSRAESVLSVEDGVAQRTVRVLSLHVLNDKGEVLYEDEQILPDGRSRKRQVAVSEKLVGDECWRAAVDRAIHEELSMALPEGYKVEVLDGTYRCFEELSTSMSYPGLLTKYVFHRVSARLPGLPSGPFETREPRPGGHLITRWAWKDAQQWEQQQQCNATSSQG